MHLNVLLRTKFALFVKRYCRNFLSPFEFHTVMVSLTENVFGECCPITPKTVPMKKKSRTEYGGASTFNGNETELYCTVGSDNRN